MNILEDMVYVIHFMSNEKVNNEFYEQQIKIINRDLGKRIHQLEDTTTNFVCILISSCAVLTFFSFRSKIRLL